MKNTDFPSALINYCRSLIMGRDMGDFLFHAGM